MSYLDQKIIFLAKHQAHALELTRSSPRWSLVSYAGAPLAQEGAYCFGAPANQSSKPFFQKIERRGFPFEIEAPFAIWAMEPYKWLYSLEKSGISNVFGSDFYTFQRFSNKFGIFSELIRFGRHRLAAFLKKQFSDFNFQFYWMPPIPNCGLVTTPEGEGGSSHRIGDASSEFGVRRSADFCPYEIGILQQSVVFDDGVIHGPLARTWSGQPGNLFRNEWIYYQKNVGALVNAELIVGLQTDLAEHLRSSGFRGCFSTDWLCSEDRRRVFLLELNPRFSSDLCLFDSVFDENSCNVPLAMLHLMATDGASVHNFPLCSSDLLPFEALGGGWRRAYSPPVVGAMPPDNSLTMARAPPEDYGDRHTNHRLLQALS
jgi:hypothetical protein